MNLTVYVPDGYSEVSGKYAAVYLLHGLDGDENEWPENGTLGTMNSLIRKNSVRPVIDGELDWSTVRNARPDALRYVSHKCQLVPITIHNVPDEIDGFFRLARA